MLENDIRSDTWDQLDVDRYIEWHKAQLGGSWFRIEKNGNGEWYIDPEADARRYDSTSNTPATIIGYDISRPSWDDAGNPLSTNVVPGIAGD
ncbi:MAG: hypothetical protein QNK37_29895 [Acidobacteriota bacterium]|nr:hypothetical protein [Acidobacteriota bacterium]